MGASLATSASTEDVDRWLTLLEKQGLVERFYLGTAKSGAIVELPQQAFDRMTRLLCNEP